jgi:hypothetical protein
MTWTKTGGDFQDPPVGTHIARCIRLIDIGTQKNEYEGKVSIRRQNIITWELPTELMADGDAAGKPFIVSKFYTTSLNEKSNLYADLVNWRGQEFTADELAGFEEKNLLDKVCLLSLTLNKKGKVRPTGIMKPSRGSQCPPRVNDLMYFSLEPDRFDRNVYESLSDGFKTMIQKSPEWAELNGQGKQVVTAKPRDNQNDFDNDSVPF